MTTLTQEQILSLPAGPELDALVAQRVMGCRVWQVFTSQWACDDESCAASAPGGETNEYLDGKTGSPLVPRTFVIADYSTNITAAWRVVEAMRARRLSAHVSNMNNEHVWTVHFSPGYIPPWSEGTGDAAPLGRWRAALLVLAKPPVLRQD